jgi:hypothetical protein
MYRLRIVHVNFIIGFFFIIFFFHFRALLNAKLQKGKTGQIAFDSSGDRLNPEYYFQNVQWRNGRKSVEKIGFYGDPKV